MYVASHPGRELILTAKSEINSPFMSRQKGAHKITTFISQMFLSVQLNEYFSSGAEISGEAVCSDLNP